MESAYSLTEPKIRYFISMTLKECRQFKERNINFIFNITMMILFIAIISGFLIYKYKGKLSNREIMEKNRQKQEYIISKLQQIAIEKNQETHNTITNLPTFERY
jgi:amino acid permease